MSVVIEAALNGSRSRNEHAAIPRTARDIALAAALSVAAGAHVLHLHVFDEEDRETLAAGPTRRVLQTVREACPGVPLSLSTSEGIEPDPTRRIELVSEWMELPELVTANMGERGIGELCEYLVARGIGIEAGILSDGDAEAFVRSGLATNCERVLIEPLDADPGDAVKHASIMEDIVTSAGIDLEQIHHGDGIASWAVNKRALERGHGIRTGLEDTTVLPDGSPARDNAALVRCAVQLIRTRDRRVEEGSEGGVTG